MFLWLSVFSSLSRPELEFLLLEPFPDLESPSPLLSLAFSSSLLSLDISSLELAFLLLEPLPDLDSFLSSSSPAAAAFFLSFRNFCFLDAFERRTFFFLFRSGFMGTVEIGASVGISTGETVGASDVVGVIDGNAEAADTGALEGLADGSVTGESVGPAVGISVVGESVGATVGCWESAPDGDIEGWGLTVGGEVPEGCCDGGPDRTGANERLGGAEGL